MRLLVKICGLKEEPAVTSAIDAGADALGFVFYDKSVRDVSPANAAALARSIPDNIQRVAVMLHPSTELWQDVLNTFAPDVLQTDAEDFARLDVPPSVERWPVFREGRSEPDTTGTYIYEGAKSGKGETVNWSRAARIAKRGRMILAGGLGAHNVAAALTTVRPYGVDISSALESAPGQKDPQLIKAFIDAVRTAEKEL